MKCVENKLQENVTRIKMYNIVQNGHIFKYPLFFPLLKSVQLPCNRSISSKLSMDF